MKIMEKLAAIAISMVAAASSSGQSPGIDYVSKVFHDGAYVPHVYQEVDLLRRYGEGEKHLDEEGLIRRRYRDEVTGLEVTITSNPDVASRFRTVDDIRVSSIAEAARAPKKAENLGNLSLKGVRIGDPFSQTLGPARRYGQIETSQTTIGKFKVERICAFSDGGSAICFYGRNNQVVAMAVGFGP
ncbi:hypothetical protein [Stenotrophomonas sp. SAU14A_NAIMI4_5]|uniref:hypothetical protein n=1 Tax=Stenotrophomonas sp. SAU14A_NAIMI4_5 TaxID=2072413 RepID=UPI00131F08B7|nr:hypothetical protein [Stenotrophomonas sp. SAU14A_NAIMI4_5]